MKYNCITQIKIYLIVYVILLSCIELNNIINTFFKIEWFHIQDMKSCGLHGWWPYASVIMVHVCVLNKYSFGANFVLGNPGRCGYCGFNKYTLTPSGHRTYNMAYPQLLCSPFWNLHWVSFHILLINWS